MLGIVNGCLTKKLQQFEVTNKTEHFPKFQQEIHRNLEMVSNPSTWIPEGRNHEKAREQFEASKLTRRLEDIYISLMDEASV